MCSLLSSPPISHVTAAYVVSPYELPAGLLEQFSEACLLSSSGCLGLSKSGKRAAVVSRSELDLVSSAIVGAVDRHYGLFCMEYFKTSCSMLHAQLDLQVVEAAIRACWSLHLADVGVRAHSCVWGYETTWIFLATMATARAKRTDATASVERRRLEPAWAISP
jgi:hypothetical protein